MESEFDFGEEMDMNEMITQLKISGQMPEDEIKNQKKTNRLFGYGIPYNKD